MSVIKVNNITSRDGTTGPVIAGITTVSSTSHLVVPTGNSGQRAALAPDPFINNLVLALPFNSESVFNDLSPRGNQPAPVGFGSTTASLPFGVSGVTTTSAGIVTFSYYYGTSTYFAGTSYLTLSTNSDFAFGIADFTIEFWAYIPASVSSNLHGIFDNDYNSTGGVAVAIRQSDSLFSIGPQTSGQGLNYCQFTASFSLNTWNHFAIVSTGGVYRAFLNGVQCSLKTGSTSALNVSKTSGTTAVGALVSQAGYTMGGYMQDLRIYKGVAKYTGISTTSANFTLPTQIAL